MKMSMLSFLLGLLVVTQPLLAEEYVIRLDGSDKVGAKYQVKGEGNETSKNVISLDGTVVQQQDTKKAWAIEAKVEIKAAGADGRASKLEIWVQKLTLKEGTAANELLPAGTVVTAELKNGRTAYFVKDAEASKEVSAGLLMFVTVNDPQKPNDDDISGTKEKKKVGDEWPLNAEMLAKNFSVSRLKVDTKDVTGSSKLVEVVTQDGKKYLKISSGADIKNITPPLPSGMQVKKSSVNAEFGGLFPADGSGQRIENMEKMKMEIMAEGKTPDGRAMVVSALSEKMAKKQITREP